MGEHRFEERGRTRFQHFSYTQARAHVAVVLCEVALQNPDTITEPLDERHIVSTTTNQGLGKVDMGIDQTWDDEFSLYIGHFIVVVLAL